MAEYENVTVRLGNVAPLMADGSRADVGNAVTEVTMREGWDNLDEVELAAETSNDPTLNVILKLIPDEQRQYAIGILEIHSLWVGVHSADAPEWIDSSDADFAAALADYFSTPNHTCAVGEPDGWED